MIPAKLLNSLDDQKLQLLSKITKQDLRIIEKLLIEGKITLPELLVSSTNTLKYFLKHLGQLKYFYTSVNKNKKGELSKELIEANIFSELDLYCSNYNFIFYLSYSSYIRKSERTENEILKKLYGNRLLTIFDLNTMSDDYFKILFESKKRSLREDGLIYNALKSKHIVFREFSYTKESLKIFINLDIILLDLIKKYNYFTDYVLCNLENKEEIIEKLLDENDKSISNKHEIIELFKSDTNYPSFFQLIPYFKIINISNIPNCNTERFKITDILSLIPFLYFMDNTQQAYQIFDFFLNGSKNDSNSTKDKKVFIFNDILKRVSLLTDTEVNILQQACKENFNVQIKFYGLNGSKFKLKFSKSNVDEINKKLNCKKLLDYITVNFLSQIHQFCNTNYDDVNFLNLCNAFSILMKCRNFKNINPEIDKKHSKEDIHKLLNSLMSALFYPKTSPQRTFEQEKSYATKFKALKRI